MLQNNLAKTISNIQTWSCYSTNGLYCITFCYIFNSFTYIIWISIYYTRILVWYISFTSIYFYFILYIYMWGEYKCLIVVDKVKYNYSNSWQSEENRLGINRCSLLFFFFFFFFGFTFAFPFKVLPSLASYISSHWPLTA